MTLESLPVLDIRPTTSQPISLGVENAQLLAQHGYNKDYIGFPSLRGRATFNFEFTALSQVAAVKIRNFHRDRNGRHGSFWVPSWRSDIPVASNVSEGDTTITIKEVGFESVYLPDSEIYRSGRYLFFYDFKNNIEFVKVDSIAVAGGYEVITLDSAISRSYRAGRFMCGIVYLCRFAQDDFDIKFESYDVATCNLGLIETIGHVQTGEALTLTDGFNRGLHFFVIDQTKSLKSGGALTAINILTSDEVAGINAVGLITFGDNVVQTVNPTTDIQSVLDILYKAAEGYDDTLDYYSAAETGGDWDENAVDAMKAADTLVRANFPTYDKFLWMITDSYGFSPPVASASQLNTDLNDGTYEKVTLYFNDDNHVGDGTRYETTFPETSIVEHRVQEEVGLFEGSFVLMFAIDQTGSIGNGGLNRMINIIDQYGPSLIAFGWVSFGDVLCHEQAPSTDTAALKTQLQGYLSSGGLPFFCDGGGDAPENVVDAINRCDELLRASSISLEGRDVYMQMVTDQFGHRHESATPATVNSNINDGTYDRVFLEFNVDGSGSGTSIAASFPETAIVSHLDYPATSELNQDDL